MSRKTLIWTILIALFMLCLSCMLAYASVQRRSQVVSHVDIRIEREDILYLQEKDVWAWLEDHGIRVLGKSFAGIDVAEVERVLRQNPFVADVQVYPAGDSSLSVSMRQRNPVLKVLNTAQTLFQVDEEGVEMPVSPDYAARVRVASGHVPGKPVYGANVRHLADSMSRLVLGTIYEINRFLRADPLWDAMFEQIYVTEGLEYELLPKVGGQVVRLGKVSGRADLEDKMKRLRLFYLYGMGDHGWEKYSVLDLRYEGQLVATRKPGYQR